MSRAVADLNTVRELALALPDASTSMIKAGVIACGALAMLLHADGTRGQSATATGWTDKSPHQIRSVPVASDVQLEVLDWGGPPGATTLVFLAGLTNNAHVFDDFAPRFVQRYRVIAITRRGHGASSWPEAGYDTQTLTHDIWKALDALDVRQAIFAGHSLAGAELTHLASEQPERTTALVYIDAAYDLTLAPFRECASSMNTAAGQEEFMRHLKNPEAFSNTQETTSEDGVRRQYVSVSAIGEIIGSQKRPDYSGVSAPALAVYYLPARIAEVFGNPSIECARAAQRYYFDGPAAFARGVKRATIVTVPNSQHNIHLVSPDELQSVMDSWLAELSAP